MAILDTSQSVTQAEFGRLIGVTQPIVCEMVRVGVLPKGGTLGAWMLAYCNRLREQAAGRAGDSDDDLDLVAERARLAKEQADRVALQNAVSRGELAPIAALRDTLAAACQQLASNLEALPVRMMRAGMPKEYMDMLEQGIVEVRTEMADLQLDVSAYVGDKDQ